MPFSYIKDGDRLLPKDVSNFFVEEKLSPNAYTIGFSMETGFFLRRIDDFKISGKVYGDHEKVARRILQTFKDRPNATGCLFSGEKGSGKTMLTKMIAQIAARDENIPTIVVNQPLCGENFNVFLQNIAQPVVVIFDEFEKVYDSEKQEEILTLFDGVYPSKKLFLLTVNDPYKVSQHMKNRPGRIFYMLEYSGLDINFVREYATDNLINKDMVEILCNTSTLFDKFNFDMLKAIVEEMNRYNETPAEALKMVNAKPYADSYINYDVKKLVYNGVNLNLEKLGTNSVRGNPLQLSKIEFSYYIPTNLKNGVYVSEEGAVFTIKKEPGEKLGKEHEVYLHFQFNNNNLKSADIQNGKFHYEFVHNGDPVQLTLEKRSLEPKFDVHGFMQRGAMDF